MAEIRRTRSYHDLTPEEQKRYDRLRSLAHRLRDPGGVRAKRCGSRKSRMNRLKEAADAMLGLRAIEDGYTGPRGVYKPFDPGVRTAGTSRDWGHQ